MKLSVKTITITKLCYLQRIPFIICTDFQCIIERTSNVNDIDNTDDKNLKTTKLNKHLSTDFSIVSDCSFNTKKIESITL